MLMLNQCQQILRAMLALVIPLVVLQTIVTNVVVAPNNLSHAQKLPLFEWLVLAHMGLLILLRFESPSRLLDFALRQWAPENRQPSRGKKMRQVALKISVLVTALAVIQVIGLDIVILIGDKGEPIMKLLAVTHLVLACLLAGKRLRKLLAVGYPQPIF